MQYLMKQLLNKVFLGATHSSHVSIYIHLMYGALDSIVKFMNGRDLKLTFSKYGVS